MSLEPLRDRVPDLGPSWPPEAVDGVRWRRASRADAAAIHEVYRAAGAIDHPRHTVPLHAIVDELDMPWLDLELDTVVGELDGRLVAAGVVHLAPDQDTARRVDAGGVVHPDVRRRGIGSAMLDWQRRRTAELLRTQSASVPGCMHVWVEDTQRDLVAIAARRGIETARWFLELTRDLADPVPSITLDAYRVVTLAPELHEPVRLARNDAFRDHWGSQPTPAERWSRMIVGPTMRQELSSIALDRDGEIAGFVLSEHDPDDTVVAGFSSVHIALVGVVRAHRKRGVAPALLSTTLRAAADAGLERAVLEVDVDSPTGALGLYSRLGFAETGRSRVLSEEW